MKILFLILFSCHCFACPNLDGLWQFRTHFIQFKQESCSKIEIETLSLKKTKQQLLVLNINNQIEENFIFEFGENGELRKKYETKTLAFFNPNHNLEFNLDVLEDYNKTTNTEFILSPDRNHILQTNKYYTRDTKELMATQTTYGILSH